MSTISSVTDIKKLFAITFFSVAVVCIVWAIYLFKPVGYVFLIAEDCWAESATFVCCMLAFCFLFAAFRKDKHLLMPGYVLLAIFVLFVGLEEISWGQRIFGIDTPSFIREYNYQQELTFHNMGLFSFLKSGMIIGIMVSLWAIVFPFISMKMDRLRKLGLKFGIPVVPSYLWPLFAIAVFFISFNSIAKGEEIGEMLLCFAFAAYALDVFHMTGKNNANGSSAFFILYMRFLAYILVGTVLLVQLAPVESIRWRMNDMAAEKYPGAKLYGHAESVFKYIFERPKLLNERTFYNYAIFLDSQGRYDESIPAFKKALEDNAARLLSKSDNLALLEIKENIIKRLSVDKTKE